MNIIKQFKLRTLNLVNYNPAITVNIRFNMSKLFLTCRPIIKIS